MAFDYSKMQKITDNLLSKNMFGDTFTLLKTTGTVYDPVVKKNVSTYEEYTGKCVKKVYKDTGLGKLKDIVKAGDVEFKLVMNDLSVIPEKSKDKIFFANVTYNIIEVNTVDPNGKKILVHTCYARKA